MVMPRLPRLQKRALRWFVLDHQRTNGLTSSSHEELVQALPADKGNMSRSLQTLEERGWVVIGRSPGGRAQHLTLTHEGLQRAAEITKKL